jgi:C1A family cysteine protease
MNEFGDLNSAEFKAKFLGFQAAETPYLRQRLSSAADGKVFDAPTNDDNFDWKSQGAVTPVKNQGQCGSCWAFSATGAIEGAWKIKSGSLVSLSEQQLVDCAGSTGNQGCNGGLMDRAFEWVIKNGGICSEAAYPYTARGGACAKTCSPVAKLTGYKDIPQGSEAALMTALRAQPVSVAVEADKQAFQFYSSGVLDDTSCGARLNHGILATGYGTQTKQYWNVKNSWGTGWGESGYIRMVRGKNQCGIASMASFPTA